MQVLLRRLTSLLVTLPLAACGGGLWIGIGDPIDNDPPSISLTSSVNTVAAGGLVTLAAAAADEDGVANVSFYRDDDGIATLLCSDDREPYTCEVTAPTDGRGALVVFAQATDLRGNTSQSFAIIITIL